MNSNHLEKANTAVRQESLVLQKLTYEGWCTKTETDKSELHPKIFQRTQSFQESEQETVRLGTLRILECLLHLMMF